MGKEFHEKTFDDGTLTKLEIFELYAREWFPVFLSREPPVRERLHVFDFFAGPGTDAAGNLGSPLRLLRQMKGYQHLPGTKSAEIRFHFFDEDTSKIERLERNITESGLHLPNTKIEQAPLAFDVAFEKAHAELSDPRAAKLVLIDQFGVSHVPPAVFERLIRFPTCDFLFFISSSTLHRFRDDPAIKQKIGGLEDYYRVHRAALAFYRSLIPPQIKYHLAPFSIKKGSNIYGLIFGSAHALGIDKFLEVAWKKDLLNGEANFDINRDSLDANALVFDFPEMRPTKITRFERELEEKIRQRKVASEADIILICHQHGVRRKHAEPVIRELREEGLIKVDFRVPDIDRMNGDPRPVTLR